MDLKYNFGDLIKIPATPPSTDPRTNIKIVKCCGNCKYAWFGHANERRGYCRLGQLNKSAPNRKTPHRDWTHMKTHSTLICDSHAFNKKGYWNHWVSRWVKFIFDIDGEVVDV